MWVNINAGNFCSSKERNLPRTSRKSHEDRRSAQQDPRFQNESRPQFDPLVSIKRKSQVQIIPRNITQETYLEMLNNPRKSIIFALGPAGTGKTMLSVQMAIKCLKEGSVSKIVVTRPAVSVDEDHGFLPGTLNQKMEPWIKPILDVFEQYYHPKEILMMLEDGIIDVAPLAMMRGRTFVNSFIIADETQNCTPNQMKMLLTRIGDGSRMVVTGDLQQADRPTENGLLDFINRLGDKQCRLIGIIEFTAKDIERHPAVKEVLSIYREE